MRERCGLVGIRSYKGHNVMPMAINALRALQHRGQEAWGVAIPGREAFRKLGLVSEDLEPLGGLAESYTSRVALGHIRYSTVGASSLSNVQPIDVGSRFFLAHNGTICNVDELAQTVSHEYGLPERATDTYVVGRRLLQLLRSHDGGWFKALEGLSGELNGGYCFVLLTQEGEIYAVRDDRGFRPLCLGWHEDTSSYVVASESCALSVLGARLVRDVKPGEILRIDGEGLESHVFSEKEEHAHCSFEYTYFAHPSSVIEGVSVYSARKSVGRELARKYPIKGDVIIPVPDSARPAALGFSEETGIPLEEGLMKDRYSKKGGLRSFIQPFMSDRMEINKWVIPVGETVRGKDVIVIDDSIVRGVSSKIIVKALREAGAHKIVWLSTFPPIRYPCYAGIDFPTQEELLAYRACGEAADLEEVNKKVAEAIGADFVGYNDVEALIRGIGMPKIELCSSCTTGDYSCLRKMPAYSPRMRKGA